MRAAPEPRTATRRSRRRAVVGRAWGFVLSLVPLLPAICPAAATQAPAAVPAAGYPIVLTRGGRLLVDARINGHLVQALLDSAAEATLIDPGFARRLEVTSAGTVSGKGSGAASFEAGLIKGVTLEAFGLTLKDQTVAVTDLADVGQRLLGRRLEIILGREIFDAARLQIDIEGRRIRVVSRDSQPPGTRLELLTEHGVETLPVRVEDSGVVRATFDLGNGAEVLAGAALAARLHLLTDGRKVSTGHGGGLGGETARQLFELHSLEVAGRRFNDVAAAIDPQPSASDLNIGVSVLRHFLITSDFAAHALWLQPRP